MYKSLVGTCLILFSLQTGAAIFDESEDAFDAPSTSSGERPKSRTRAYPGGRDEQDLKVQAQLPLPSRAADGSGPAAPSGPAPD